MCFHRFDIVLKNAPFPLKHIPTLRRRNRFTVGISELEPMSPGRKHFRTVYR